MLNKSYADIVEKSTQEYMLERAKLILSYTDEEEESNNQMEKTTKILDDVPEDDLQVVVLEEQVSKQTKETHYRDELPTWQKNLFFWWQSDTTSEGIAKRMFDLYKGSQSTTTMDQDNFERFYRSFLIEVGRIPMFCCIIYFLWNFFST